MKRDLLCKACAPTAQVDGKLFGTVATGPYRCDTCNAKLTKGMDACATVTFRDPYEAAHLRLHAFDWVDEYLVQGDLIGLPDPKVQAQWVFKDGFYSCADAEANGYTVTDHKPTRDAIDREVAILWKGVKR